MFNTVVTTPPPSQYREGTTYIHMLVVAPATRWNLGEFNDRESWTFSYRMCGHCCGPGTGTVQLWEIEDPKRAVADIKWCKLKTMVKDLKTYLKINFNVVLDDVLGFGDFNARARNF